MRMLGGLAVSILVMATVVAYPAAAQVDPAAIDVAPIIVQKCCTDDQTHQIITGRGWQVGDVIDLYINGDYVATDTAEPNDVGSASPVFDAQAVGNYYLDPGEQVTFVRTSDGRTEAHTVTGLSVSHMDIDTDTVTGVTEPGAEVVVFIPGTTIFRSEIADPVGDWTADFSVPGNQPGEEGTFDFDNSTELAVAQFDTDGNATFWQTTPGTYGPILVLVDGAEILGALVGFTGSQFITGQSWDAQVGVDLFINGSYIATSITDVNSEGSASPFFELETLGAAVAAGDEVMLSRSDGSRTESHIVGALALTGIDLAADTVSGTAEPGTAVSVATVTWLSDAPTEGVVVTADADGAWVADFSSIVDLTASTVGFAGLPPDEAGNGTALLWQLTLTSKDQCKKGGWQDFGVFKNQGQCVKNAP